MRTTLPVLVLCLILVSCREGIPEPYSHMSADELNREGLVFHSQKNFQESLKLFKYATVKDPTYHAGFFNIACAESRLGHPKEALAALRKAYEISPGWVTQNVNDPDLASVRTLQDFQSIFVARPISAAQLLGKTLRRPSADLNGMPTNISEGGPPGSPEEEARQAWVKAHMTCSKTEEPAYRLGESGRLEWLGSRERVYRKHTGQLKSAAWIQGADTITILATYEIQRQYADFAKFDEAVRTVITGQRGKELLCGDDVCLCVE